MYKFVTTAVLMVALTACGPFSSMITIDQTIDAQEQALINIGVSTQLILAPESAAAAHEVAGMYLAVIGKRTIELPEYNTLFKTFLTSLEGSYTPAELVLLSDLYTGLENIIVLKADELSILDNNTSVTVLVEAVMQTVYERTGALVTYQAGK